MKKFKDLTANDFPGIEPVQFQRWREVLKKAQKQANIAGIIMIVLMVIIFIATRGVKGGVNNLALALLYIFFIIIFSIIQRSILRESNQIAKELGITRETIKMARRGELK